MGSLEDFGTLMLVLFVGTIKAILVGPLVLLVILFGNFAVIMGLWPCHFVWTLYCILKTKKFNPLFKALLLPIFLSLILLWPLLGVTGSIFVGWLYGIFAPIEATFEAAVSSRVFVHSLVDGTWSSIRGGCIIVRDFSDICLHSYFSVMNQLLEHKGQTSTGVSLSQIPGCTLAGFLGLAIDVPAITIIVVYKAPIVLFTRWRELSAYLSGKVGPLLETVCIPFAGLMLLLWPTTVAIGSMVAIASSFVIGSYASAVAFQENSTMCGLKFVIAAISMFDEYTNDILLLRNGSCLPRPWYRKTTHKRQALGLDLHHPLSRHFRSGLKTMDVWHNFFEACKHYGKELIAARAIWLSDLEGRQYSNNRIIKIGLPAYVFLKCFLRSVECNSKGFVMRDGIELTSINRPEGRVFDWFFQPMTSMKEQIKTAQLNKIEEAYLLKLTLYCGDHDRVATWHNGGLPPGSQEKKDKLDSISSTLQDFSQMLTILPTFLRRFEEVVKVMLKEAQQISGGTDLNIIESTDVIISQENVIEI